MAAGYRSNIYLQASAISDLETLFKRLQAAGDIPANKKLENIGEYRSKLITYALQIAVASEPPKRGGKKASA